MAPSWRSLQPRKGPSPYQATPPHQHLDPTWGPTWGGGALGEPRTERGHRDQAGQQLLAKRISAPVPGQSFAQLQEGVGAVGTQETRLSLCSAPAPQAGRGASMGSQFLPALPAIPAGPPPHNVKASALSTSVPPQEGFYHCQLPVLYQAGLQAAFTLGSP